MTNINITLAATTSATTTLIDRGTASTTATVAAGTSVGASSFIDQVLTLTLPLINVTGKYRVQLSGTGTASVDNYWYPLQGHVTYPAFSNYTVQVTASRTTTLNIKFHIANRTAAGITLPALALSAYAHFYSYPW